MTIALILLFMVAAGGVAFAFAGGGGAPSQKRLTSVARPQAGVPGPRGNALDANQQRRRNVQALLKDIEKQQAEKKQRLTLRRRFDQAGIVMQPRTFYMLSVLAGLIMAAVMLLVSGNFLVAAGFAVAVGLGLPRWVLMFVTARRQKKFTQEFANGIDVIVRSVKSGLPTNEALRIVAREIPEPVSTEFHKLVEGLKVGVTLEQGLKRMYDSMPTAEVSFFAIVMTIQQKSGGNLSEALSNLSAVLRDRKRLQGKIKAMSSEAKASAGIIGSLPPGVGTLVYLSSPKYITPLFTTHTGWLMIGGCLLWMSCGIAVMKKMINFKH